MTIFQKIAAFFSGKNLKHKIRIDSNDDGTIRITNPDTGDEEPYNEARETFMAKEDHTKTKEEYKKAKEEEWYEDLRRTWKASQKAAKEEEQAAASILPPATKRIIPHDEPPRSFNQSLTAGVRVSSVLPSSPVPKKTFSHHSSHDRNDR